MAKRYTYGSETTRSRLASWSIRVALFSLVATIIAIVIVRSGILELRPAMITFASALGLAALAVLLALGSLIVIWREGLAGISSALIAILIGLGLLAYPAYLGAKAHKLPWIYDITTDPIDPPRFEVLSRIRPRGANPIIYAGLSAAEQQREAYPDIEPLESEATQQAAFDAALAVVTKRKWRIVDLRPPTATRKEGRIEAVARSPIMGFRDDVVVRVRTNSEGSRIDVRSSSRYGSFDFGDNASRIRKLVEDIDFSIGSAARRRMGIEQERSPLAPEKKKAPAPPQASR
jgi:uncharacterized protein (DUF1499 family)